MGFRPDLSQESNDRLCVLGYFILTVSILAASVLLPMGAWTVPPKDFLLIAWNPGRQLLQHGTVVLGYPYPLWTPMLLLPFVLGSPELGAQLWFICSLVLLAASIFLLFDLFHWPLRLPVVVFTSLFVGAFGPVFTTFWLGQLNFVPLFSLLLAARAVLSGSWFLAGGALGLSLIKPQLAVLVIAGLFAAALSERRWKLFGGFASVLLFLIALAAPFGVTPRQILGGGIVQHLEIYLAHTATLWGLILTMAPDVLWLPAVLSGVLLLWLAYLWLDVFKSGQWREQLLYLIGVSTIVNLLILPYRWFYNQAVLIVPIFYAVDQLRRLASAARVIWLVALVLVVYFVPTAVDVALTRIYLTEVYQVIPVLFLFPVVVLLQWQTKRNFKPET
jgi:hypothetical protein